MFYFVSESVFFRCDPLIVDLICLQLNLSNFSTSVSLKSLITHIQVSVLILEISTLSSILFVIFGLTTPSTYRKIHSWNVITDTGVDSSPMLGMFLSFPCIFIAVYPHTKTVLCKACTWSLADNVKGANLGLSYWPLC